MRNVLGKRADKEKVLNEYSSIIDTASKSAATTAYEHTSQLIDQLDTFGISPKLNNFKFYASATDLTSTPVDTAHEAKHAAERDARQTLPLKIHWANIFGVLITGILLSLGAPFWFEQLKNLSSLRDGMNPSSAAAKAK
jgi:hypothetical protein